MRTLTLTSTGWVAGLTLQLNAVSVTACGHTNAGLDGSGVKVQEKQQLDYQPDQRRAVLTSTSNPMVKGGERFMTRVRERYSPLKTKTLGKTRKLGPPAPSLVHGGTWPHAH